MENYSGQKRAVDYLYPDINTFDQRMLAVDGGHKIYVEQSGNPRGVPVVVVHGGPGGGSSPAMRRFFDPAIYRIILFDQRGCGHSRPFDSVENNTTDALIRDMEAIRVALGIETWVVFGGSWGATLGVLYAQAHPERVDYMVLRGVFLMRKSELEWFYGGGAGMFWPELWQDFCDLIPPQEQDDLIRAYHRRLFCGDLGVENRYARAWAAWENALASAQSTGHVGPIPAQYARAFSRLECHYFYNGGFLHCDDQILMEAPKIRDIPGVIVQGRLDLICPPTSAYDLAQACPALDLRMVAGAGHALTEAAIAAELVRATDELARL